MTHLCFTLVIGMLATQVLSLSKMTAQGHLETWLATITASARPSATDITRRSTDVAVGPTAVVVIVDVADIQPTVASTCTA